MILLSCNEIRPAYFLQAFGRPVEKMLIVSFGKCNFRCLYCKRIWKSSAKSYDFEVVYKTIDDALARGYRIRLSGGDPCAFQEESLEIARYCKARGHNISIAHNGSDPGFVESISPYLEYAAIDLKAITPEKFSQRTGLKNLNTSKQMIQNSLYIQETLSNKGILVDVRTCVFDDDTLDDFLKLAELISSHGDISKKFWTIRAYSPKKSGDLQSELKPLPFEKTLEYIEHIHKLFPELKIGFRTKWVSGGFLFFLHESYVQNYNKALIRG